MSNGIKDLDQAMPFVPFASGPEIVPLAVKSILKDIVGKQVRERLGLETLGSFIGERPITERDVKRSELRAMQDAAIRAMGGSLRDKGHIEYEDYGTTDTDDPYADVGGSEGSGLLTKLFDPDYNVKATLGQAMVERDPDTGEYYIIDQYNFNERKPEPTSLDEFQSILERRVPGQGAYGVVRSFGEAYGSPSGEGQPVRINLGDLEAALARSQEEDKPGLFSRGLAYLGNLLKRDREPSLVQAGPSVADGTSVPPAMSAVEQLKARLKPVSNPNMSELDIRRAEAEAMKDLVLDDFNFDR